MVGNDLLTIKDLDSPSDTVVAGAVLGVCTGAFAQPLTGLGSPVNL